MHRARASRVLLCLLTAVALLASPALVPAQASGSSDWTAISAGLSHTCGIRDGGHLYCWGSNDFGELGDGSGTAQSSPVEVTGAFSDWTSVTTGTYFSCGRRATGRLFCWGSNFGGQLGDGTTTNRSAPTEVSGARTDWAAVRTGFFHTCAQRSSGALFCWGSNSDGQLGDGSTSSRPAPAKVLGSGAWTSFAVSAYGTCGLKAKRLLCWGKNSAGQLGDGTTTDRSSPVAVATTVTDWTAVDAGTSHACARRSTGKLLCWGANDGGQLGDGSTADALKPVKVAGGTVLWSAVSAGGAHTCARQSTGRLSCWGVNGQGQVGDGTANDSGLPTSVWGRATDWKRIEAGQDHTCALTTAGRAYCWGSNSSGQLGNATTDGSNTPTEVYVP